MTTNYTPVTPADLQALNVLLVGAYDNHKDYQGNCLPGSMSLQDLQKKLPSMAKHQPVVFYCGCPNDEWAKEKATALAGQGFTNVNILKGGAKAFWAMAA